MVLVRIKGVVRKVKVVRVYKEAKLCVMRESKGSICAAPPILANLG